MVMVIMMIRSYMDDAFIHDDDSWTNEQGDASSRIFQKLWYSTNYHQPCNFKFSSWYLNTSEKARKCIASLIYETICSPAPSAWDNSQIYILTFSLKYDSLHLELCFKVNIVEQSKSINRKV